MTAGAFDINDAAWDPSRDSHNERLSLLRELDPTPVDRPTGLLDPSVRTVGGKPLGRRRTELLLGCTFHDLEALANRVNALSGHDDDAEVSELNSALEELEAMLGGHRVLKSDSDERTIERMPVAERRRARALQLRIDGMRLRRYDPVAIKRRELTGAIPSLVERLERARDEGDDAESSRLQSLLAAARSDLELLSR